MSAAAPSFVDPSQRLDVEYTRWTLKWISERYSPPDETTGGGNDGLCYVPESQRLWAWTGKRGSDNRIRLIDSIARNYPIGSIILNKKYEGGRDRYAIYDGRHRVQTIHAFINDQFKVRGAKFSELSALDKHVLLNTTIPVVIVDNASDDELSEIFDRLNSGKPLSDRDHCWNWKNKPLVASTIRVLARYDDRFREIFGGQRFGTAASLRPDLPNWVGLLLGLATANAANMTTSWIRLSEHKETDVDCPAVTAGLNALHEFYTAANEMSPLSTAGGYKAYKKLGFINAFYLADWVEADDKLEVTTKWLAVIKHIRKRKENKNLVKVTGAQNLDQTKIDTILGQVNTWYNDGESSSTGAGTETDSDEDSDYD